MWDLLCLPVTKHSIAINLNALYKTRNQRKVKKKGTEKKQQRCTDMCIIRLKRRVYRTRL